MYDLFSTTESGEMTTGHMESSKSLRRKAERVLKQRARANAGDGPGLKHELDVRRIELQMLGDELRYTKTELEDARNRYFELFEFAPIAFLTLDEGGHITEANHTACQLMGIDKSKLKETHFSLFLSPQSADCFHLFRRQVYKSDGTVKQDFELLGMGGKIIRAELHAVARPAEKRIQMALVDISRQNKQKKI